MDGSGDAVNRSSRKGILWPSARRKKKGPPRRKTNSERTLQMKISNDSVSINTSADHQGDKLRRFYQPKSLAVLCERVLKKSKPQRPKDDTIQDFTVVGGKPLRKRKVPSTSEIETASSSKTRRTYNKGKKPIGRPPKKRQDEATSTSILSINPEPILRIKEELHLPVDYDPLSPEDDYTVTIKEEVPESDNITDNLNPQPSVGSVVVTPLAQKSQKHGAGYNVNPESSGGGVVLVPLDKNPRPRSVTNLPLATVIMDDFQIFANSVAEQLRALPIQRALLVQLDIQSMLDNERQLIMHEF